jgi:alpha-tubulin suppressor-like RCC1 family protein
MKALDFGNTNDLYFWGCHTPFSEDEEVSLPTLYKRPKQYVNHTFNSIVLGHDFAFLMVEAETNIDELLLYRYANSKSFPELPTTYSMANGKIVQVAVGREHAIMVRSSEDGDDVVSIGRNNHGQLGTGNRELVDKDTWTTIPHFQGQSNVKVFAGGGNDDNDDIHGVCFAIHTDKTVFAWGSNHAGQLGLGDTNDRSQPTLVNLSQVKKICIGNNHTLVLLEDRTVRSFGDNEYSQLGCGMAMQNRIHCNDGPFILDVHDISTFANTCIAVRIDGRVFVWGQDIASSPKAVPELNGKRVSTVACTRASFYALTGMPYNSY